MQLAGLQVKLEAELSTLKIEQESALAKAEEIYRAELAAAQADREAKLDALKLKQEMALAEVTESHRTALAALASELQTKAEQRRIEIAQAEELTELAETATHKLAALHRKEAEMLAATEQVFDTRTSAMNNLFRKLQTTDSAGSYQVLIDAVSKTESAWMFEAVMRHGLDSDDQAMWEAAWFHLIQTDFEGATALRPTLSGQVARLGKSPRLWAVLVNRVTGLSEDSLLWAFLVDHATDLVGGASATLATDLVGGASAALAANILRKNPALAGPLRAQLPSTTQWAVEVVDFSSEYSSHDGAVKQVLGQPDSPSGCRDHISMWAPRGENDGIEYVRVRFDKPVMFPEIGVHEPHRVGTVRKIVLWDNDGVSAEYDVQDPLRDCPGVAKFEFHQHVEPVTGVTVVVDTRVHNARSKVDAISLTGWVMP